MTQLGNPNWVHLHCLFGRGWDVGRVWPIWRFSSARREASPLRTAARQDVLTCDPRLRRSMIARSGRVDSPVPGRRQPGSSGLARTYSSRRRVAAAAAQNMRRPSMGHE